MTIPLVEYFRCVDTLAALEVQEGLSPAPGYFAFGGIVCFGRLATGQPSGQAGPCLEDAMGKVDCGADGVRLPFDLSDVVTNLRREQYTLNGYGVLERLMAASPAERIYYLLRPALNVGIRKHLQRLRLRGWERLAFPKWPLDVSVDALLRTTLGLVMKASGVDRVPFVWFWPDGATSALMMTHDVEGAAGRAFCGRVMDVDDEYGIKSAFQLVPQGQEQTWRTMAAQMRRRGFEVNLHDLNHDGRLFDDLPLFRERAKQINRYTQEFGCQGFRSGAMYREQQWYDAFEFSYDMSVPNVAHLEPQRGGCCTVMPYFVGNVLELPLTTVQDYSVFHILGDYSIGLWKQQVSAIRNVNGLITFLAHPDYLAEPKAFNVYVELLEYLRAIRANDNLWVALPADVDRWWRNRQQMKLVQHGASWRIEGPDADRARLAYAIVEGKKVRYEVVTAA